MNPFPQINELITLCENDFFLNDPLGRKLSEKVKNDLLDMKNFYSSFLSYYLEKHSFKIPDLIHHYFFNRFIQSKIPEHQAFYQSFPLHPQIEKHYFEKILFPLKNLFQKTSLPVEKTTQPKQPFLKEKEKLYHAFFSQNDDLILRECRSFFKKTGGGIFSSYYYYEWDKKLKGVTEYQIKYLSELLGYERQKESVVANTRNFLEGNKANHVFLYGSRGTGKTSLIKALLEEFKEKDLRVVKIYREDIEILPYLAEKLKKRKEFFILNLDDISYDEGEIIFKKHKVAIDSFFDRTPSNILLYATSNSQEIVKFFRKETTDTMVIDNRSDEERKLELPERQVYDEKRAFTERFGLTVFFGRVEEESALRILDFYRKKYDIKINLENLKKEFDRWIPYHGSVNGRTIENFIRFFINYWRES
ncbi:MAG TPA: hypothetical protein DHW82_08325 [Spirochaetia bacterium]|nr:MAG: hypothetical protein A2Y41_13945 [Spirochaetes bacterium GWB1_36_13]HCL56997.1 hypothetical protein [Spirochaetia bacterium]